MIVQWCIKGMHLADDQQAVALVDKGTGIVCNWWRDVKLISQRERAEKLTAANLDMHVNHFDEQVPATGRRFAEGTPFISLSAGTIERDTTAQTNLVHRARRTAAWFGTEFGTKPTAYLFTCWVILAPRPAVGVEAVAEEVRDLNAYRRYSPFQTEGEVTAKIVIPARQVRDVERWDWDQATRSLSHRVIHNNTSFVAPDVLSNVRALI